MHLRQAGNAEAHNHFAAKGQDDAKIAKIHTNLILEKFETKKTDQTKQSR